MVDIPGDWAMIRVPAPEMVTATCSTGVRVSGTTKYGSGASPRSTRGVAWGAVPYVTVPGNGVGSCTTAVDAGWAKALMK